MDATSLNLSLPLKRSSFCRLKGVAFTFNPGNSEILRYWPKNLTHTQNSLFLFNVSIPS